MRAIVLFGLSAALVVGVVGGSQSPLTAGQKDEKKDEKPAPKITPAAEVTLGKALKAKMSGNFTEVRLGDVLKEFAAQVDMRADVILLWAYGKDFPYDKKVTYSCRDKPLEVALDELFKKHGELGYVVVSKDGDRRDGWVLLTTTGERGQEKALPPANAQQQADAADKLALAKKLLIANKNEQAKTVLTFIVKNYPTAKATAEAKELLAKLEK